MILVAFRILAFGGAICCADLATFHTRIHVQGSNESLRRFAKAATQRRNRPADLLDRPQGSTQLLRREGGINPGGVVDDADDSKGVVFDSGLRRTGTDTGDARTKAECRWREVLGKTNSNSQVCEGHGVSGGAIHNPAGKNARIALVVRGESYRSGGGHYNRTDRVTRQSLKSQRKASQSHVRHFIEPFEACGLTVDVFLGSYEPMDSLLLVNSTQLLIDSYTSRRVVGTLLVPHEEKHAWDQPRMFSETLGMVTQHSNAPYVAIFVLRHDVILKQDLVNFHEAAWDKVLFAFRGPFESWRVGDVVEWIPWSYLGCVVAAGFQSHHSGNALREMAGQDAVDFFLPGIHRANSEFQRNDMYKLVRPEANTFLFDAPESQRSN